VPLNVASGRLVADQLNDEACRAYGSLPDRLYIVHDGVVVFQGGIGPFDYKVMGAVKRQFI
jgi:hypothetical protein